MNNPLWLQPPSESLCAQECGARCCRAPGTLKLSDREAQRMAALAPRPLTLFRDPADGRLTLLFSENGGQCPLLGADARCTWYANRPLACIQYPEAPDPQCRVWPRAADSTPLTGGTPLTFSQLSE